MTISEVSKQLGISVDTLRYYEKIELIPEIQKSSGGIRIYTEGDIALIEFIKCMRAAGLSIETLKKYIVLFLDGEETMPARKEILVQEREKLIERINALQSTLDRMNIKIDNYDNRISVREKEILNNHRKTRNN